MEYGLIWNKVIGYFLPITRFLVYKDQLISITGLFYSFFFISYEVAITVFTALGCLRIHCHIKNEMRPAIMLFKDFKSTETVSSFSAFTILITYPKALES